MTVQTVPYQLDVPKDFKDVVDLLNGIAAKIVSKAPLSEYADLIDESMKAIDGIQNVSEEIKSQYRDEAAGYLVHKLLGTLLPVNEAPAPTA